MVHLRSGRTPACRLVSAYFIARRACSVKIHRIFFHFEALGFFRRIFRLQLARIIVNIPAYLTQEVVVGSGLASTCLRVGLIASAWSWPLCSSSSKVLYTVPREREGISGFRASYICSAEGWEVLPSKKAKMATLWGVALRPMLLSF